MDHDSPDWVGLFVRFEIEHVIGCRPPHADRLVRLAGVGLDNMLEYGLSGLGYVGVGNGDEVVVHGCLLADLLSPGSKKSQDPGARASTAPHPNPSPWREEGKVFPA